MTIPGASSVVGLLLMTAALAIAYDAAAVPKCGSALGDEAAITALVADARAACPCGDFERRGHFRRCVRERIRAAIDLGTLPAGCRARVARMANRSTCGGASSVTCCASLPYGREACTIVRSAIACEARRGGTGQVGSSDWCHDACPPAATPTPSGPTPTAPVTPTPTSFGIGPRCVCRCGPPPTPGLGGAYGCPSFHDCVVMSFVPTDAAECDALDDGANRGCHYDPDAPRPYSEDGPVVDACNL